MAKNKDDKKQISEDDMAAELLLKDADEAMRQERLNALWEEWGGTIIGTVLMIIFGTMVGIGWQNWRTNHYMQQTSLILNAQQNPQVAAEKLSGEHAGLYALLKVEDIIGDGENVTPTADLLKAYETAAESGLPREWDILAEWGLIRMQVEEESADYTTLITKLENLAGENKNPYAPVMYVEAAILSYKNGNNEQALSLLDKARENEFISQVPPLAQRIERLSTFFKNRNEG
jgi:hypothetical protein